MNLQKFDAVFDEFRASAFRLETLPRYSDEQEDAELALYLAGKPLPERSTRTDPWLQRLADTTAAGKYWQRVHVLSHPLTDYLQFELLGYEANLAAGEDVRIADRDTHPELADLHRDFWLFDAATEGAFALLMRYNPAGQLLDFDRTNDSSVIEQCLRERDLAVSCSVPLRDYAVTIEA